MQKRFQCSYPTDVTFVCVVHEKKYKKCSKDTKVVIYFVFLALFPVRETNLGLSKESPITTIKVKRKIKKFVRTNVQGLQ